MPLLLACFAASPAAAQTLTFQDILALPAPPPARRLRYGNEPPQFGELRLPAGRGPHPVAVVIHGGCWLAGYELGHISSLCAALTGAGVATWSLEYRRVGDPGGGWPGTFQDVASGTDRLRELARKYPLDLSRLIAIGHSAGGHLALWLAARKRLPRESPLFSSDPLPIGGVLGLAAVTDLGRFSEMAMGGCGDTVHRLMGGGPELVPERYRQASPAELLPLGLPQKLICGARDRMVPLALARTYQAAAAKAGDDVELVLLPEAAHFEMIAPSSAAWPEVWKAARALLSFRKTSP